MKEFYSRIEQLKIKVDFLENETFAPAPSGTRYKVFISKKYTVRFRDDGPGLLERETQFLQQLNHSLIPKIVWSGRINNHPAMIENRLSGQTLDNIWRNLPPENQTQIIRDITEFLIYLRGQKNNKIYSVNTGKEYNCFFDYLTDGLKEKVDKIGEQAQSEKALKDILAVIQSPKTQPVFQRTKTTLVHGDLIIHNLLTDGKRLTGVLDWEFALWGDPDFDLARLWYYRECAKAYEERGTDQTYEADFMNKLVSAVKNADLVEDEEIFDEKYRIIQAYFRVNALLWAVESDNPKVHIQELVERWN